jgi:hypothetical protein
MHKKVIRFRSGRWVCLVTTTEPYDYRSNDWDGRFLFEKNHDGDLVSTFYYIRKVKRFSKFSQLMLVLKKRFNYIWGRINGTI